MYLDALTEFDKQWALLTAGTADRFNTMTVSWGGLGTLWGKPVATVYVRPSRYTYAFMEESDVFTVSFYPEAYRKDLSVLGSRSGRDGDKVALTKLTPQPLPQGVTFAQATQTLVCRKLYHQDLLPERIPADVVRQYYPQGDVHRLYIGEVVSILP